MKQAHFHKKARFADNCKSQAEIFFQEIDSTYFVFVNVILSSSQRDIVKCAKKKIENRKREMSGWKRALQCYIQLVQNRWSAS